MPHLSDSDLLDASKSIAVDLIALCNYAESEKRMEFYDTFCSEVRKQVEKIINIDFHHKGKRKC